MAANPESISGLAFLSELPPQVVSRLLPLFQLARYRAGACIFREGESDDRVFVVVAGQIALEMHVPEHGRRCILSLGPGDLLGWSPLLEGPAMTATAVALQESEVLVARGDAVRELCWTDCEVGYAFMRQVAKALSKRLIATRLQLLDLFRQDAQASEIAVGT